MFYCTMCVANFIIAGIVSIPSHITRVISWKNVELSHFHRTRKRLTTLWDKPSQVVLLEDIVELGKLPQQYVGGIFGA